MPSMATPFGSFLDDRILWLFGGALAVTLGLLAWKFYRSGAVFVVPPLWLEVRSKTFTKKDHVYLRVPARLGRIPNISPFSVKLETWLRMESIPYEVVETLMFSPSKQMFPYIYLNGEEMSDSRFIIEMCAEHFGKTANEKLSPMERAISVAFSNMVEENLSCAYAWHRYNLGAEKFWSNFLPPERLGKMGQFMLKMKGFMKNKCMEGCWNRGIGRHSPEQIYRIAEEDIQSISTYLADKDFFLGKEPSVIDCTLFGSLVQLFCLDLDFPPIVRRRSDWANLAAYVERMKSRFYPDWEQLCNPVQTTKEKSN